MNLFRGTVNRNVLHNIKYLSKCNFKRSKTKRLFTFYYAIKLKTLGD